MALGQDASARRPGVEEADVAVPVVGDQPAALLLAAGAPSIPTRPIGRRRALKGPTPTASEVVVGWSDDRHNVSPFGYVVIRNSVEKSLM